MQCTGVLREIVLFETSCTIFIIANKSFFNIIPEKNGLGTGAAKAG